MHRALLIAWLPLLAWLIAALAGIWLLARITGARPSLAKLRRLGRCEAGSVQTLSFVLTLPIFIMLVLFIVQVSQLMIGMAVVQYAAFAAARAACVWLPADTPQEPANTQDFDAMDLSQAFPNWRSHEIYGGSLPQTTIWKYRKIWSAAALACIPISPSKQYLRDPNSATASTLSTLYGSMASSSGSNPKIPARIRNKAAYAAANTRIEFSGIDRDGDRGPTYNPFPGYYVTERNPQTGATTEVWVPWKPNEIGWEDPITVTVRFRFALLPGPGRFLSPRTFLSTRLQGADGTPDKVSDQIFIVGPKQSPDYLENVYFTILSARVTMSNEGLKSVMPYVFYPEPIN